MQLAAPALISLQRPLLRHKRTVRAAAGAPAVAELRALAPSDVAAAVRLHKFAKLDGQPVFGTDMGGVTEMVQHAAQGLSDTFGLVATVPGAASSSSTDVLGVVCVQLEEAEGAAGPSTSSSGTSTSSGGTSSSGTRPGAGRAAVLLTLVVRGDARARGVGALLLQEARRQAAARGAGALATDVAAANAPALRFFERAGFRRSARQPAGGRSVELTLGL